jgi:hypothetical protein
MRGTLFTSAFLEEGITETREWQRVDANTVDAFRSSLISTLGKFRESS